MAGRTNEQLETCRAYMRYVIKHLADNPDKLNKLGFDSVADLQIALNFKNLPAVKGIAPFNGKVEYTTFADAFNGVKAPYPSTLKRIQEQFEIDLTLEQFEDKLKESDSGFDVYYKAEKKQSAKLQGVVKNNDSKENILQQNNSTQEIEHGNDGASNQNGRGSKNRSRWIILVGVVAIGIAVIIMTIVQPDKPVNEDHNIKPQKDSCIFSHPHRLTIEKDAIIALRTRKLTDDELDRSNKTDTRYFFLQETVLDSVFNNEIVNLEREDGKFYYVSVCRNGKLKSGYIARRLNVKTMLQPIWRGHGRG